MSDLIHRESVINLLYNETREISISRDARNEHTVAEINVDDLKALPSVEPERRNSGKWIWNTHIGEYECSECGCSPVYERYTPDVDEIAKYRFCRWCGSIMEETNTLDISERS